LILNDPLKKPGSMPGFFVLERFSIVRLKSRTVGICFAVQQTQMPG
jgi:hypothetical protein